MAKSSYHANKVPAISGDVMIMTKGEFHAHTTEAFNAGLQRGKMDEASHEFSLRDGIELARHLVQQVKADTKSDLEKRPINKILNEIEELLIRRKEDHPT